MQAGRRVGIYEDAPVPEGGGAAAAAASRQGREGEREETEGE